MAGWRGLRIDPYVLSLLACVAGASAFPAHGDAAGALALASKLAVALLFFLHGARLTPSAVMAGLTHWRLHGLIFGLTFILCPVLGLILVGLLGKGLPEPLSLGLLYLCCLPSTVQSSIAFTAVARGNVAAAVASASASNLLGMALTPLLVSGLIHARAGLPLSHLTDIGLQLLAPFLLGHALQTWLRPWLTRQGRWLVLVDRGSILLIVYAAFSAAVVAKVWSRVSLVDLAVTAALAVVLLAAMMVLARALALRLGIPLADQITILFCGSKKSLVTGAPMAAILFPPATAGIILLPLMLYHQAQLMVCAVLAQQFADNGAQTTDAASLPIR